MRYLSTPSSPAVREAMSAGLIGCMTTPTQGNRIPEGAWWAADNGKFGRHYVGDEAWFSWLCAKVRAYGTDKCLFAVAPDVPFDAAATLACSLKWLAMIRTLDIPAAFCAQDGADAPGMIPWDEFDTLFIAGSDRFKEGEHARALAAEAKARGKTVHVGRVNSRRRLNIAETFGADSCDGTYLRYGPDKNLPILLGWLGLDQAATDANAADRRSGRAPHWHPRPSSTISAADGRIHAPESYRSHLIHGVPCDELTCEVCVHDCSCARCNGWCRCDRPPNAPTPGGAVRFNDDGRLSKEGLLALADEIAEALGPPWEHDRTNHTYWRTELVCPDDDWRISIEVAPGRHKATATGLTPTLAGRWWRDSDKARIGFTATRDPEDIAADLRRRLFPPYARALVVERAGIAAELARREHFALAAARLQAHLPADGHRDRDVDDRRFHTYWTDRHGSHNRASLDNSGDTVHLDLRQVPLEVACALIDVIEGRAPSRRPARRRGTGPRRHARRRATRHRAHVKAARP